MKLSAHTVAHLPARVVTPGYDRTRLQPGILHVGVGNFHRAHQALYLDELLNAGGDPAWGICGAGVRPADVHTRALLAEQDWLFSVVAADAHTQHVQVVGSLTGFVPVAARGHAALLAAMTNPATRIVSLTITEGGYFLDAAGQFNTADPAAAADLGLAVMPGKPPEKADAPNTVFGVLVAALAQRRAAGTPAFTVMSCDNLPGNGNAARQAVLSIAHAQHPDLARWIEDHATFPNSMVDRITPATSADDRQRLNERLGYADACAVLCEPFRQWVIEDQFANGRPALENVGVTFTRHVQAFETMKIRLLNGGHALLAYPAALMGIRYAHQAMQSALLAAFVRRVLTEDVLPFVPSVSGCTTHEYLDLICTRFANPAVADTVARLCHDGSNRQPKFVLPSIRDNLDAGRTPHGLALACALWCRYCAGSTDAGEPIDANDPDWASLQAVARRAQQVPATWLQQRRIYADLGQHPAFADAFGAALRALAADGVAATLRAYLAKPATAG